MRHENKKQLEHIGFRCSIWRRMHNITQDDIAHDLGVSRSVISKFENGKIDSATILMEYVRRGFKL